MNDIEQIEKFLGGELSQEELQSFDLRLKSDKAFADTFAIYKTIDTEMSETADETALRDNLSEFSQKYFDKEESAKVIPLNTAKKKWWLYAAAAVITGLLIIKPWKENILSNEQLYAQYAVPVELPAIVRGANDDSLLVKATNFYNKVKYSAALILLDSIVKQRPTEAQLQLALGICFVETGRYDSAINRFDSLAVKESVYKYEALKWKALTFLKQGKKEACIDVLKQIPADAANYKETQKLLAELLKK